MHKKALLNSFFGERSRIPVEAINSTATVASQRKSEVGFTVSKVINGKLTVSYIDIKK